MSYSAVFILKDDETIEVIRDKNINTKWFDSGFIRQSKNVLNVYANDGQEIGSLKFKSKIKNVVVNGDDLIVETNKMAHLFKMLS